MNPTNVHTTTNKMAGIISSPILTIKTITAKTITPIKNDENIVAIIIFRPLSVGLR